MGTVFLVSEEQLEAMAHVLYDKAHFLTTYAVL